MFILMGVLIRVGGTPDDKQMAYTCLSHACSQRCEPHHTGSIQKKTRDTSQSQLQSSQPTSTGVLPGSYLKQRQTAGICITSTDPGAGEAWTGKRPCRTPLVCEGCQLPASEVSQMSLTIPSMFLFSYAQRHGHACPPSLLMPPKVFQDLSWHKNILVYGMLGEKAAEIEAPPH